MPTAEFLSVSEGAHALGLRPAYFRSLLDRGIVPSIQLGPRRRVNRVVIERLIAQSEGKEEVYAA